MKRLFAAMSLAAALAIAGGCKSDTSVVGAQYDEVARYPNVTLSQPSLSDALGFQEPIVTRNANNIMQVSIPVRARSNDELHVEYRVIWLDPNLQPLRPEMSWKPLRLEPRQPYTITETASTTSATNYNLQLRWSRP